MLSRNGLVSIIIPVHNRRKAEICVEHIKRQTYKNIEIILVDFPGFPAEKRNYGYRKSHGVFVLFLDEDEYMAPPTISACVRKFKEGFDIVGIPQIKLQKDRYIEKCISILRENVAKPLFFKREVLDRIGLFCPEYVLCDDLDVLIRAKMGGYKYGMINLKEGYILHDETNSMRAIFQKTFLSRKSYKRLQIKYGSKLDIITRMYSQRKRILRELESQPTCIPGALLVMLILFAARRVP
ncbi:MAG: glycosyltransferase family 2 protein [Candidatus Bathyarchaeales archaeon]